MPRLIGPFHQLLSLANAPLSGPLSSDNLDIIENAGILVEGGNVVAVGNFNVLAKEASEIDEIARKAIGLPGFIDAHTHLIWGGSRERDFERRNSGMSYQEILDEGGGIFETVGMTRKATESELAAGLKSRAIRHLTAGVTTIEVKTGYGLNEEDELRMLRTIQAVQAELPVDLQSTFLGAHVCPKEFDRDEYLDFLATDLLPIIKSEGLSNRVDIFIEAEAFDASLARPYLAKAKALGFDITAHAGQFSPDGVAVAVEMGARSADHLETISAEEVRMLAKSKTAAVALPGASLGLGMPFTPCRKLLDAGASVVIATDWNPGSAPMGDLLTQSAVLATYEKLSAAEVFAGITYRAGNALNLTDRGRLIVDQVADIVAFEADDFREILYYQGSLRPFGVWKRGYQI